MRYVQRARPARAFSLLLAVLLSLVVAVVLLPLTLGIVWLVLSGAVIYLLLRRAWGLRSGVLVEADGSERLMLADQYAWQPCRVTLLSNIEALEVCDYPSMWSLPKRSAADRDNPFHRVYQLPGYRGPGLIVRYRLSAMEGDPAVLRSVQFPVPDAVALREVLGAGLRR